ncbi:uncharacterized protein LY89DRAFT_682226, partial [Mollisia scopiformis]
MQLTTDASRLLLYAEWTLATSAWVTLEGRGHAPRKASIQLKHTQVLKYYLLPHDTAVPTTITSSQS